MLKGLIILLFTYKSSVVRGLTRNDSNTCFETISREYYCCSDYEKINDECIKCKLGFMSRKGSSCEPCALNYFGNRCSGKCMCKESQRCDNVKGCVDREIKSTLTTKSIKAGIMSSEESVTKVYEEDKNDGLSKTELLTLFCGALSGIMVLLGFLGISNFVKKRMCMSKSKRDKPSEREEQTSDEHGTLDAVTFHESLYEIIDDSHLDSIFVPQTGHSNPRNDDESQSSRNSANYNDDRSSYLEPVSSSPISKISSSHRVEQSQKTFSSTRISTCIKNQTSCNLGKDNESSSSRSSTNSNDDQSIYLHPLSIFITNDISCYTEEQSRNVLLPSANNFTCIADRTSIDPYLAITQDNPDDSDDSSSEFPENATNDRSSYLHPYNTLFYKTSSCHIYKMCQNKPFSE